MERLVRTFLVSFIASFASLSLWAAEAKAPEGHPIGSAGFNDMLGKQIKPGTLSVEEQPDGSFLLTNKLQTVSAHVTHKGVTFDSIGNSAGKGGFSLELGQWGREGTLQAVQSLDIYKKDNAVYHTHADGLAEKFSNTSGGIQQDFIVAVKPQGRGDLHIRLQVSGATVNQKDNGAIIALNSGRQLTYDRLNVTDSAGKNIPAEIHVAKNNLLDVVVHDAAAQYPLVIDPTVGDENWVGIGAISGTTGGVSAISAMAISGQDLYVGAGQIAGKISVNYIAKWNGSSWTALGQGMNGPVGALAIGANGVVYAGGAFTNADGKAANHIASWDGNTWNALGSGLNNSVYALAIDNVSGNLYVGGSFTTAGGASANYISQWDGSNWSPLSTGMSGTVTSLLFDSSSSALYVGGQFSTAGGVAANSVAKWNGSNWSPLGSGFGGYVYALAIDSNGNLYAGGSFFYHIAKWNGTSWNFLGTGVNNDVYAIKVDSGGHVYVGGSFTLAGGVSVGKLAMWDGAKWSAVSAGVLNAGSINGLLFDNQGNLYACGDYYDIDGLMTHGIAIWNGSSWSALGDGFGNYDMSVRAAAVSGNSLFVGGMFVLNSNSSVIPYIAMWDGTNWHGLDSGVSGYVNAIAVGPDGSIYVGGQFTVAGNSSASYIAKWDGTSWQGLGSGMNGYVNAIAVDSNGNVYVGGQFTVAGGLSASYIAKWDGASWHNLGSGTNNFVYALTIDSSGNLYAGGKFTSAGGLTANYIAKWDGSNWFSLSSGMNDVVKTLAHDSKNNLYAGGNFTTAGGSSAYGFAKWDNSAWTAPMPIQQHVTALSIDNKDVVYAATEYYSIYKWNGVKWNTLGSGTNWDIYALALGSNKLYVGGGFTQAGGAAAVSIAQWNIVDTDGDGWQDYEDAFPNNAAASVDSDGDGYPDYWNEPLAQTLYGCTPTTVTCNGLTLDAYPLIGSQHLFPAGTYPNPTGTGGYVQAPAGSYAINGVLAQCAAGTFTSTTGNSSCTPAPVGSYVSGPGATSATQCASGTFQSGTGATSCNSCPALTYSSAGSAFCHIKARSDFDNTGVSDVLMRDSSSGNWQSFLMGYNANIASSAALAINASGDYVYKATLDANGDGTADVLTRKTSTGEWVLWTIQNNAVTNTTVLNMTTDPNWSFQGVGDFNGDGTDDILIRHTTGYWFVYFLKNGQMYDWGSASVFLNADFVLQAVGDMTGDGIADALLRSTSTGKWYLYNAATGVTTEPALWASSDWQFQTLADLNGDGIQDVVLRITNPSATYPGLWGGFIMNSSGNVASSYVLSSVWMNLGLQLAASGDYNGDGTGDLLIRNTNTGAYYLFTTNPPGSANPGLQTLTSIPALNAAPWGVLR